MLKINDEITGTVEKLTYGNEGLIRYGEDKFVVFIKNVLPKEEIKVKITSINKSYAKSELIEILKPSKHRTKPICNLYNACGSCNMQICDYYYSIEQKTSILKEIFDKITEINEVIKSPEILEYRHKIQFPVQQTKVSNRILMGYFKNKSHNLTNIKFCPIQPAIVNDIAEFIRNNFPCDCYDEKKHKGLLKNVLFRITSDKKNVLINFVLNTDDLSRYSTKLIKFATKLNEEFNEIKSVFANLNPKKQNKILDEVDVKLFGNDYIIEDLEYKKFAIGPSSFFQVNPKSATNLFNLVKNNIKENSNILDAYGGVGAIGIFCKEKAKKITLIEENKNAIQMAKINFKLNNIQNYEILEGDSKKHLINFKKESKQFDYIILDPPRSGCDKEGLKVLSKLAKNIIYVSCNPQTLKRDIKILNEENFNVKSIQGVDLFPFTHHIECVCILNND